MCLKPLSGLLSVAVSTLLETTYAGRSCLVWLMGSEEPRVPSALGVCTSLCLPVTSQAGANSEVTHAGDCSTWFRPATLASWGLRRSCRSVLGRGPGDWGSEAACVRSV